jgi:hypothetical protein
MIRRIALFGIGLAAKVPSPLVGEG